MTATEPKLYLLLINIHGLVRGHELAVVVENRRHEALSGLVDLDRVCSSDQPGAAGLLDAIEHYDILDGTRTADS